MLEALKVRNFALMDTLSLTFEPGFNVLTGETGAGKSILVGALSFLLGAKADPASIRAGAEEAEVSAVVSLTKPQGEIWAWLAAQGISPEEGRLIVRRTMKTTGRGAIYIQETPVSRGALAECMALLFDLHGQHTHESLLKKETHRKYLDRFAGLEEASEAFHQVFLTWEAKKRDLAHVSTRNQERVMRLDLLHYAVEEITQAAPQIGEIPALEEEARRLGDFEKLAGVVQSLGSLLCDDEGSILSLSRRMRGFMENAALIDRSLAPLGQRLEDWYYETEDMAQAFRKYRDALRYDPERLEAVQARLALLYRLRKKYGGDEAAIQAYRAKAEAELEALSDAEAGERDLVLAIARLETDLASRSKGLSEQRIVSAQGLQDKITAILGLLGMPKTRFSVSLITAEVEDTRYRPWGMDEVEFCIAPNAGEPVKELSRIASGGELSRIMLAIKTVLSDADARETLVFDEIDTGIGGEVALAVGEYLARVGRYKQILCVTHLASIAVRAYNHLRVEKGHQAGRTVTRVAALGGEERRKEIARMLAGDAGPVALAHADALLVKYRNGVRDGERD
ncbi:MAG: DNA repair protein RecN [Spirochaetaceae bacterium]|jgi:DNA repair protein RecN (Recombination protein N)|nr:DNA repair protein RecN [Spirochaetaceae bacterium]